MPEKTARVLPFASAKAAPADTRNNKPVVLVVEDNPGNILVATTFLEQLGYAHEIARNGVEAVEKYASSAYAIVLMDVQLPGMDGYEATGKIRDIEKRNGWARAKVIAMTAFAYEGDKEKCLDAGMDDYIAKPVVIADLEAKISQS